MMSKYLSTTLFIMMMIVSGCFLLADNPAAESVSVQFSNPSQQGKIIVSLINGSIFVKGTNSREVRIEATGRGSEKPMAQAGRRVIPRTATGLRVEELNNVMKVGAESHMRAVDLTLEVPRNVDLELRTVNQGVIIVKNVAGEIEVNNTNGSLELYDISGSILAHTVNGHIKVTFVEMDRERPMYFTTLNGDVDITFPGSLAAEMELKTTHGDVVSDFRIDVRAGDLDQAETSTRKGRYVINASKALNGTIGGGGQELKLQTFNGDLILRKK
jgi:DUF4097 and DUF4098 domain-containing protein YvlB